MARVKRTLDERIKQLNFELLDLYEEYKTQLYLETMPKYDPLYQYCYGTSSTSIKFEYHDVDCWLRAVMKHMSSRRPGHGGASTASILITIPVGFNEQSIDRWLEYATPKLKAKAMKHKSRVR